VYHIELRQFPHNHCRFNVTERELRALLAPWVLEKPLELGERKWSPHEATITVLEGPQLELHELSMGRGWRAAQRQGEDVTARVVSAAAAAMSAAGARAASQPAPAPRSDASGVADPLSLAVELASLLGPDAARLLAAWREVSTQAPELSPSEALGRAEAALGSVSPRTG
jgi:hypothetical protein